MMVSTMGPIFSVAVIPLSVMHMASNQTKTIHQPPSLITSEKGEPWTPLISDGGKYEISKRVTDLLRSPVPFKIISLNLITNIKNKAENRFWTCQALHQHCHETPLVALPAVGYSVCSTSVLLLNHLASPTLQGIYPVQALEGTTPDISFPASLLIL